MTNEMVQLIEQHLHDEERWLETATPMVRAVQTALTQTPGELMPEIARQHQELATGIDAILRRRQELCERLSNQVGIPAGEIRLSRILPRLPEKARAKLQAQVARVRDRAAELIAANRRLSIHVHIFLDAYQRLLRGLTGTASGSGRYGPQGKTESPAYRPLLQVRG